MIFTLLDVTLHVGVWVGTKIIVGTYNGSKYVYDWYYGIEPPNKDELIREVEEELEDIKHKLAQIQE